MFYFDGEKWMPFKKKVTYTKEIVVYDNIIDGYAAEKDLKITDVILTDEQLARLETARELPGLGIEELTAFVMDGIVPMLSHVLHDAQVKAEELKEIIQLTANASPETLVKFKSIQKPWFPNRYFEKGLVVIYNEEYFLVNQGHTAQKIYLPGATGTEALYSPITQPGTIGDWVQPTGAHDAYNMPGSGLPKSDPVTHQGKTWESTLNGNVWEPGVYGWKEKV